MKIIVAGNDRSKALGAEIAAAATARETDPNAPEFLVEEWSALALRSAQNDSAYLDVLTRLMWSKCGVSTRDFHVPRKPGALGKVAAWFRRLLWRVFRYQHDRIAFQQNVINLQLTAAMEFMRAEREKNTAALEKRIAELEAAAADKGTVKDTCKAE